MVRRQWLIAVLLVTVLAVIGARVSHSQLAASPVCCLAQIHKEVSGQRSAQFGAFYLCRNQKTAQDFTTFRLTLKTEGTPCDPDGPIPNGSVLSASGITTRRADGLAEFIGSFTIQNGSVVLFTGTMHAIDRIGTHVPPFGTEACDQPNHLEGWVEGFGYGSLNRVRLHALIVALSKLPQTGTVSTADLSGNINGVLINCS